MLSILGCLVISLSVEIQVSSAAFVPADREELATAVRSWNCNASSASHTFGDISQWDVSKVTDMWGLFEDSNFNGDISHWDVSKVTDMGYMFHDSSFSGDLSRWDVSKVRHMERMFWHASCSVCDHVPPRLEFPCWSFCGPSHLPCMNAGSKNECNDLVQCAWCESKDQLHKLCFTKGLKPPESGWACEGNDASTGFLARTLPLVLN